MEMQHLLHRAEKPGPKTYMCRALCNPCTDTDSLQIFFEISQWLRVYFFYLIGRHGFAYRSTLYVVQKHLKYRNQYFPGRVYESDVGDL